MSDPTHYHSLDELKRLSLDELRALWDAVPPERKRGYRDAYEKEIRTAGAEGSDLKERIVTRMLIRRYDESALVPLGTRWARTPSRVQEAARTNTPLDAPSDKTEASTQKPSKLILGVFAVAMMGMFILLMGRGNGGNSDGQATATRSVQATLTPLALDAADEVVTGGDASRSVSYPISLQASLPASNVPRVWVVQRRTIRAAEWQYDLDPDIASYLNGLAVQPAIGIPWSPENAEWFAQAREGSEFMLTLNTGKALRFGFQSKTEVLRSETGIFRQVDPGLVLLLIGETDEQGLPTATRTLIRAVYSPEQELTRDGLIANNASIVGSEVFFATSTPIPTVAPEPFADLQVQLIEARYDEGWLETRLWLYNRGDEVITIRREDIWLTIGYSAYPLGPRMTQEIFGTIALLPDQAIDLQLVWDWGSEPFATIQCGAYLFSIELPPI